jgi:cyclase
MRNVLSIAAVLLLTSLPATAQMGDPAKVVLKTTPVAGGISLIEGANGFAGGNVGVSVGEDGMFIIDDELKPLTPKLKVALANLSKKPVRFVINTHWHSDHTGGNADLAATGAIIVAHDSVRERLSVDHVREFMGKKISIPASPPTALPVLTFGEDVTLHLNGDDVHVMHVAPAHTDGDVIVHFKKGNVIHAGDAMVASYPLVDVDSGGRFEGFIAAADRMLAICNDSTKIIPGHGPLMSRADLVAWRELLIDIRDRVAKLVAAGKSLDEIKAEKPLADLDAKWGQGFINADLLLDTIYKTMPPAPPPKVDKGKRHHN